jgi:hypothetical protein
MARPDLTARAQAKQKITAIALVYLETAVLHSLLQPILSIGGSGAVENTLIHDGRIDDRVLLVFVDPVGRPGSAQV